MGHETFGGTVHWTIVMFYGILMGVLDQLATSRVNGRFSVTAHKSFATVSNLR